MRNKRPGTRIMIAIGAFCFPLIFFYANTAGDDLEKAAARIMGDVFVKNSGIRTLRVLSDEIGPRLTGSEAAHRAASYCLDLLRNYGLTNVHAESFGIGDWLPGQAVAEALEPFHKRLRVDTLGFSINTSPGGLVADVIDVGHGTQEDYEKAGPLIKGKIVLAGLQDPADPAFATKEWQKVDFAARKGAAACLIIAGAKGGLTRTRASSYGGYSPIPAVSVAYEDGTWIRRQLEGRKTLKLRLLTQNTMTGRAVAENVVGDIAGKERPEELVILGAHLDSWFLGPGAADNALGVSIALETARILSAPDLASKRTVRIVLFSGEEEGLLGSFQYVNDHESELDKVVLMVNLDMTGLMYPGVINPYGACPIGDKLGEVLPMLAGLGVTQIDARYPYDSDDFNFVAKGVPALGLQGRGVRDWSWGHSYADTFEKIEADKLNMNTAAVATIIYFAANRREALSRRLSQPEVIKYFKERNLDKILKQEGTWKKLGFPGEN
ncbi:MAG: M28 family peptidase [Candidatus Aminicenantes bacterium]|nr:M28 family peptidase [Candidatus Aminicenantes bacterium]